jgi:hypothetical protein
MALDPNIALGVRPIELPNQLAQFAQASQIQNFQRQNELANRTIEQEDALNRAYASSLGATGEIDPNMLRRNVAGANLGSKLPAIEASLLTTRKLKGEVEKSDFQLRMDKANKAVKDIASFTSRDEILADLKRNRDAGNLDPAKADQIAASIPQDPAQIPAWQLKTLRGILDAKDQLEQQFTTQDFGGGTRVIATPKFAGGGGAQMVSGSQIAKTATPGELLVNARAQENLKIAQENQRREADPAFQQKIAEAKTLGQTIAKDKVVRAAQLPKVLDTAEMTLREVDDLIGKRDEKGNLLKGEKPHPGFETAVGFSFLPGARFVPGAPAADFQARFDQVKGGAFLQAFETLKGGGSITNVEGDKGTAALNRMSLAQSEKEFVQAAREFQDVVRTGVARAKKMSGGSATAGGGDVDTSNPLLK